MVKVHPQLNSSQQQQQPARPPSLLVLKTFNCFLICQLCLCLFITTFALLLIFFLTIHGSRREIEVYITDASLTNLDIETVTNDTFGIAYDMWFNITVTNPNTWIGVYYDLVQAYVCYADHQFAEVTLTPFYQGHKTTNTLRAVFEGNETLTFDSDGEVLTWFGEEKRTGVYSISVMLSLSVRTKVCNLKHHRNPPHIYCYLRLALSSLQGKSLNSAFQATQCGIVQIIM